MSRRIFFIEEVETRVRTRNEVDVTSITLDEVMRLINPRIKKIRQTGEMQVMCPLKP